MKVRLIFFMFAVSVLNLSTAWGKNVPLKLTKYDKFILKSADSILQNNANEYEMKVQEQAILKLLIKNPESEDLILQIVSIKLREGKILESENIIKRVVENSKNWIIWFWYGTIQLMKHDIILAKKSLDVSIKLSDGMSAAPWIQRGIVEQEVGRYDTSLVYFNNAYKINQKSNAAIFNIAFSSDIIGENEIAKAFYTLFLKEFKVTQSNILTRTKVSIRLKQLLKEVKAPFSKK